MSVRDLARRVDDALARQVSLRSIAVVRLLVGLVTIAHLAPIAIDAVRGDTYHDRFHEPYLAWLPDLPPALYTVELWLGVAATAAMAVGVTTRVATITATTVVGHHLLLSTTHVHNNRAYLFAVLLLLALSRCGDVLSVDAWRARRAGHPLRDRAPSWPLWLLRFECATVYAASGFSKLVDPDWFRGTVTWGRVVAEEASVRGSLLPGAVADLLLDRSFHTVAAKVIIATELLIAAGLWWRRTRPFAVTLAVVFHVMIELSAEVQIFSYLGIAVLVVWAPPSLPPVRLFHNRRMPEPPAVVAGSP